MAIHIKLKQLAIGLAFNRSLTGTGGRRLARAKGQLPIADWNIQTYEPQRH
jgi:hypothetical protein